MALSNGPRRYGVKNPSKCNKNVWDFSLCITGCPGRTSYHHSCMYLTFRGDTSWFGIRFGDYPVLVVSVRFLLILTGYQSGSNRDKEVSLQNQLRIRKLSDGKCHQLK